MKKEWHLVSHAQDVAQYAIVEAQIFDLRLAMELLDRVSGSADAELIGRMKRLAVETLDGATKALTANVPTSEQAARIVTLLSRLAERLNTPLYLERIASMSALH